MAEIIRMPKLSDTMTEGVIANWYKNVGDQVNEGDLLADIETDKATMEFESYVEGTLLYVGLEVGKTAPVNAVLAVLGEKGEDISDILKEESSTKNVDVKDNTKQAKTEEVSETSNVSLTDNTDQRLKISPLAKKIAKEKNIDIRNVRGTGENGRIVKKDLETLNVTVSQPNIADEYYDESVSQMRKTIANRLSQSKFSAPHFYLTMDINMDEMIIARDKINTLNKPKKVSFNDIIVKAVSIAITKHPEINVSWRGDTIRHYTHTHIGVAVSVTDGLIVPVVRSADKKSLTTISEEIKTLVQKAKNKALKPQDWEGNTFTISNLGMFDIEEFTAIINSPESCILAVGAIKKVPVIKNDSVIIGNVMKVTLSCDHRTVDGVLGAKFLRELKGILENPYSLIL